MKHYPQTCSLTDAWEQSHRLVVQRRCCASRLGRDFSNMLHQFIGYMALYGRGDGVARRHITVLGGNNMCFDSELSENASVDSVSEHHFLFASAPPDDFTRLPTVSGDRPRGRQPWRNIVGVAGQPVRRPLGYQYDNPACSVKCSLPTLGY